MTSAQAGNNAIIETNIRRNEVRQRNVKNEAADVRP